MNDYVVQNYFRKKLRMNSVIMRFVIPFLDREAFFNKWSKDMRNSSGKKGRQRRRWNKDKIKNAKSVKNKKCSNTNLLNIEISKLEKLKELEPMDSDESFEEDRIENLYREDFVPYAGKHPEELMWYDLDTDSEMNYW